MARTKSTGQHAQAAKVDKKAGRVEKVAKAAKATKTAKTAPDAAEEPGCMAEAWNYIEAMKQRIKQTGRLPEPKLAALDAVLDDALTAVSAAEAAQDADTRNAHLMCAVKRLMGPLLAGGLPAPM